MSQASRHRAAVVTVNSAISYSRRATKHLFTKMDDRERKFLSSDVILV